MVTLPRWPPAPPPRARGPPARRDDRGPLPVRRPAARHAAAARAAAGRGTGRPEVAARDFPVNRGGLCHRAGSRPDRSAPASAWSPRRPGRGRLTAFTLARPVAAGTGGPGRVLAGDDPLGMLVAGPQRGRAATS